MAPAVDRSAVLSVTLCFSHILESHSGQSDFFLIVFKCLFMLSLYAAFHPRFIVGVAHAFLNCVIRPSPGWPRTAGGRTVLRNGTTLHELHSVAYGDSSSALRNSYGLLIQMILQNEVCISE